MIIHRITVPAGGLARAWRGGAPAGARASGGRQRRVATAPAR